MAFFEQRTYAFKKHILKRSLNSVSMNKNFFYFLTLGFFCLSSGSLSAQDDAVLFSVNGNPVLASEFKYIYAKTNQEKADFSEASLQEYLDLYTKFKLKVQKARDLQLDTIPALKSELEGYRRQLANSYLTDKEVTEKLVREVYDRSKKDISLSHIFFAVDKNAKAADTLAAYNKAMVAYKAVKAGMPFETAAVKYSEDKSAAENKGLIGHVTAMFPDGFYTMESGVYNAKEGDVVGPFRSFSGYHVVKVGESRPARGTMEIAQILCRKAKGSDGTQAKNRADGAYQKLMAGENWEKVVLASSDDKLTASNGGVLGTFGINQYQKSFEDAAFAIDKDGGYSKPVETTIGWHIIKRISRRPAASYEDQRRVLAEKIKRDSRSQIAKKHMITRIKSEAKFKEDLGVLSAWKTKQVDSVFTTFRWKASSPADNTPLFNFGGGERTFSVGDFEKYVERAARERMRAAGTDKPLVELIDQLYAAFVDDATMLFEESKLDEKYPDFKALMREYEEGILLFDATKQLVWDKANVDTVGLKKFFNDEVRGKYKWDERAMVDNYTIKSTDEKLVAKIRKYITKKPSSDVLKKFNKKAEVVSVAKSSYERGKGKTRLDAALWKKGAMSVAQTDAEAGITTFSMTSDVLAPMPKELNECRGYAVADYQDYLDKKWVADLQKEYTVKLNDKVFEAMIMK